MNIYIKTFLCPVVVYTVMMALYMILQEVYVRQCTINGGLVNMLMNIPTCTKISNILQTIGDQFISLFISLVGLLLAIGK